MTDEGKRKREESLRVFNQAAPTYDRVGPGSFSYFGQRLVDFAEIPAGANVLDVAAGRGALLFPAAAKVGTTGHVTGIDFSPNMVRETSKDIESRKLRNAEMRQMDAEQINFADASFDWVLCGFALWMFADPVRVLQEFHRVLRGGGRVALSTWAADSPSQTWCNEVLRPFVFAPEAKDLPAKIVVRFDTPLQIETALQQAYFKDIRITVEEKEFIYADEEQYWSSLWSAGFRRQLEKITPELLEQAKSEVFRKLQTVKKPDGFHKVSRALFAFGAKPVS
ncbi:MAG TPA: methyltransferase domain-containing protein [Candidatus Binatia bacterium]|jgi:ubiquinone/menaquinone biosynthesis C-methylase UbiE